MSGYCWRLRQHLDQHRTAVASGGASKIDLKSPAGIDLMRQVFAEEWATLKSNLVHAGLDTSEMDGVLQDEFSSPDDLLNAEQHALDALSEQIREEYG